MPNTDRSLGIPNVFRHDRTASFNPSMEVFKLARAEQQQQQQLIRKRKRPGEKPESAGDDRRKQQKQQQPSRVDEEELGKSTRSEGEGSSCCEMIVNSQASDIVGDTDSERLFFFPSSYSRDPLKSFKSCCNSFISHIASMWTVKEHGREQQEEY